MKRTITSIFNRFKESYNSVLESDLSQNTKPLYLDNLKESNKNLIRILFGDKGVEKFETMLKKELNNSEL